MKYVIAAVACAFLVLLYAVVGATLEWKRAGGFLPMIMLFAAVAATWRGITASGSPNAKQPQPEPAVHVVHEQSAPSSQSHNQPSGAPSVSDNAFYDAVAGELETGQLLAGTWARAYAEADGDDRRARAAYIRLRVSQLTQARTEQQAREQELERQRSAPPLTVPIAGGCSETADARLIRCAECRGYMRIPRSHSRVFCCPYCDAQHIASNDRNA